MRYYKKILITVLAIILILSMGLTIFAQGDIAQDDSAQTVDTTPPAEDENPAEEPETELPEDNSLPSEPPAEEDPPSETEEPEESEEDEEDEEDITLPGEEPQEEPSLEEPALVIDDTSIVVFNYSELKTALETNNGFTTVYLGEDITADTNGITVHSSKPFVIIDGHPPGAAEGVMYTFTQSLSTAETRTIRVTNANTAQVTLRNIIVAGQNNAGVVSIPESVKGVVLTHENLHYTGPQPASNRGGTTRFINSTYDLVATGGIATNELAETLHAEMGGTVTVTAASTANSILWLTASASTLTFLEGADVHIQTGNYFVYTSGYTPDVTMQAGSSLRLVDKLGFTYTSQSIANFIMYEGAQLYIDQNATHSWAALRVSKLFQMEPGSAATMIRTGTDGIALRLSVAGARAVFNQPGRVFLYSSANVPLRFTGTGGTLSITTSALNLYAKTALPIADGLDNMPNHIWNKAGGELLTLSGKYNEAVNQSLTHNLTEEDPVVSELSATNFNLEKNQLLAFGSLALGLDPVYTESTELTGNTVPGAQLKSTYTLADGQSGQTNGNSAAGGTYTLPITGGELEPGSQATVIANYDRLKMRQMETVSGDGIPKLAFLSVPDKLLFENVQVPDRQTLVNRQDTSFALSVADTRPTASPWRIDASLSEPLGSGQFTLPNALVFQKSGEDPIPLTEVPVTVYRQESGLTGNYDIQWGGDEGILLHLTPGEVYSDVSYTTTIQWTLVDAP